MFGVPPKGVTGDIWGYIRGIKEARSGYMSYSLKSLKGLSRGLYRVTWGLGF